MQSSRRRRDCPVIGREHRLIISSISLVRSASGGDVRRQRRRAEIGDRLIERWSMKGKRKRNLAIIALAFDLRVEMAEQAYPALVAKSNHVTGRQLPRRLHQSLPA